MMFYPGKVWNDTEGNPIQAHGGGVLYHEGVYYWYGENKAGPTAPGGWQRVDVIGVSCYSSRDLTNWKNEGVVLKAVPDDPGHDLHPSKVAERPKVIYNEKDRRFVMWLHIDEANYAKAMTGVAVSDSPVGPFTFLRAFRPNGNDSRDMTIFQDDDGAAYLVHSSDWNKTTIVARLTGDYLDTTGDFTRAFVDQSREGQAVMKREGVYYMFSSGCTGWNPNPTLYAASNAIMGRWELKDNPCVGPGARDTYGSQSTYVIKVRGEADRYILMLDRWNPQNLSDSRYVWLPISFEGGRMSIPWQDAWEL